MLDHTVAAAINHVLRQQGWPLARLAPFAGRSARFLIPPLDLAFTVAAGGELAPAAAGAAPAATFLLTPPLLLRLTVGDAEAYHEVRSEGDAALASAVLQVAQNLRWDAEEDLSRVVGDIPAHRLAQAGAALDAWGRASAQSLLQALRDFITEEQPLIARAGELRGFVAEVDRLRDDVERLEKRIRRLPQRHAGKT